MNKFNIVLVLIFLICCQGGTNNARMKDWQRKFYRIYASDTFDIERQPIAGDIDLIGDGALDRYAMTQQKILKQITSERNYYRLFYYSKFQNDSVNNFLLLGYYDYYYDLILVSMKGDSLNDYEIIASHDGDGDYFTRKSSILLNKNIFRITTLKGQYKSFSADIVNADTIVSFLRVNKSGELRRD